jgi:RNA polymerase sigma-70 factor, ECF subfamily
MKIEGARNAVSDTDRIALFEEVALPHLAAAYRLARWLTRDEHEAQDVVQDAYMRAFKYFDAFAGGNARAWLLSIVRNSYYTLNDKRPPRSDSSSDELDVLVADGSSSVIAGRREIDPDTALLRAAERDLVDRAIADLPDEFREVVVLREFEDLSYKEIAHVADIPIGTVMSRLSRARRLLKAVLSDRIAEEREP